MLFHFWDDRDGDDDGNESDNDDHHNKDDGDGNESNGDHCHDKDDGDDDDMMVTTASQDTTLQSKQQFQRMENITALLELIRWYIVGFVPRFLPFLIWTFF